MTPVAVFAFNRPDHLRATLDSLAACDRLDECQVHIFCDGPRGAADEAAVIQVRQVVTEWAEAHDATVVMQEHNLGLAGSIVGGVTELCERFGRVVVIEDDLLVSPDFLHFMLTGLDCYADVDRVKQVTGFMFPIAAADTDTADGHLIPLSSTWGWATWQRAWQHFDGVPDPAALVTLEDDATRARFDPYGDDRFTTMLRGRINGDNDSWGVLWYWRVFQQDGLVLWPTRSLVWMAGFDGSGTHCDDVPPFEQDLRQEFTQPRLASTLRLPDAIEVDRAVFEQIKTVLRPSKPASWGGLRKKISGLFRPGPAR